MAAVFKRRRFGSLAGKRGGLRGGEVMFSERWKMK